MDEFLSCGYSCWWIHRYKFQYYRTTCRLAVYDIRLSTSAFFTASHRPDVFNLLHQQYVQRINGENEFSQCLTEYETIFKPPNAQTDNCLRAATMVLADDAFSINNVIFKRDSNINNDENSNRSQEKNILVFMFVIVHPCDRHGSDPVHINFDFKVFSLSCILMEILIHCSVIHSLADEKLHSDGNPNLGRLLSFVKKCVVPSVHLKAKKCFRNSSECEEATEDELDRLAINCRTTSESIVHILAGHF